MLIGAHVSASGGLHQAPENAAALGLETFQFFSRSPQTGRSAPLAAEETALFQKTCARLGFTRWYVHAPYIINLASPERRIRETSISVLRDELGRADRLGATAMMTHLGSARGTGQEKALRLAGEGLRRILEGYEGRCRFLVENSAGAGEILGDDFSEIAAVLETAGDPRLGVCLDTAHAFASGYDWRTPSAVAETVRKFDAVVGLARLAVVHANDSAVGLGEHKDRHAHIGHGLIGLDGFRGIVASPALGGLDLILETPDDGRADDIAILKKLRGAS